MNTAAALLTSPAYPGRSYRTARGLAYAEAYAATSGRAAALVRLALDELRAGNPDAALSALDAAALLRPKLTRAAELARAGSWTSARRLADGWARGAELARRGARPDALDFGFLACA